MNRQVQCSVVRVMMRDTQGTTEFREKLGLRTSTVNRLVKKAEDES